MSSTSNVTNFSWTQAESGSIEILGTQPAPHKHTDYERKVWYRRQTAFELGSTETAQLITSIHLTTSLPLSSSKSSSSAINIDVLKSAVRSLRFEHPAIAGKLGKLSKTGENVFVYEVPSCEDDIEDWLRSLVLDRSDVLSSMPMPSIEEAIEAITHDLGRATTLRPLFNIHYIPRARSYRTSISSKTDDDDEVGLVFFLNHSIFDAIGAFQIMDRLVAHIADALGSGELRSELRWGEEVGKLPNPIGVDARVRYDAEKGSEVEEVRAMVSELVPSLKHAHKLPIPRPDLSPFSDSQPSTGLITRTLSPSTLTCLLANARSNSSTIFGVLFAASALAALRTHPPYFKDPTEDLTLPILISPIDMRPLACTNPSDRTQWSMRVSVGFNAYVARDLGRFVRPISHKNTGEEEGRLREDVWTLAREVRGQVEGWRKYGERMNVWLNDFFAVAGMGIMEVAASEAEDGKAKTWYPATLSSIGVMDKYLSRAHPIPPSSASVRISSPRLSPVFHTPIMGGYFALHAFTWEGELVMAWTFPEEWMGRTGVGEQEGDEGEGWIVERFIDEFMRILESVCR